MTATDITALLLCHSPVSVDSSGSLPSSTTTPGVLCGKARPTDPQQSSMLTSVPTLVSSYIGVYFALVPTHSTG